MRTIAHLGSKDSFSYKFNIIKNLTERMAA
jgi:hypothetical protein